MCNKCHPRSAHSCSPTTVLRKRPKWAASIWRRASVICLHASTVTAATTWMRHKISTPTWRALSAHRISSAERTTLLSVALLTVASLVSSSNGNQALSWAAKWDKSSLVCKACSSSLVCKACSSSLACKACSSLACKACSVRACSSRI